MDANDAAAYADLTKLVKDLNSAAKASNQAGEKIMDQAANQISERMKTYAPKRSGRLYQSIRVTRTPGSWTIGPVDVPYAVYQEFGTGTRGEFGGQMYVIRPKKSDRLHFQIGGKWVSAKEVHHPGIPAHPYARPAAREVIDGLASKFGDMGVNLIVKGKAA